HAPLGDARSGRAGALGRPARRGARPGHVCLHRAQLLPAAAGGSPGGVSALRQPPCPQTIRMRSAECGVRNGPGRRRGRRPAPPIGPCSSIPHSAFRTPHRLAGAVVLVLLATGCRSDRRTPLVIYSPHGRDLLTLLERHFEQSRPDVDVRWLDMGSQEVYDRLRSERANPPADVWFGGPSTIFARGAHDLLLAPFRPSWGGAIGPHGRGPGDLYFAAYETPAVIVYAEQAVTAAEAPQDWDDLLQPRWRGKVLIRDPLASGTMRAVWGMIIERGLKQTGDTTAGFQWLRRLDAQTKEYPSWRTRCGARGRPPRRCAGAARRRAPRGCCGPGA